MEFGNVALQWLYTDNFNKMLFIKDCCYLLLTRCFVRARRVYSCHVLSNVGKLNIQLDFSAHSFSDELYTQRRTYVLLLYHRCHSKGLEYSIPYIYLSFYMFIMVLTKLENCVIILRCIKLHAFEYLSLCNNVKQVHS